MQDKAPARSADGDSGKGTSLNPHYPPAHHLLRDLRIHIETLDDVPCAGMAIVPEICTPAGGARAGAIATLVDVVSGTAAARAVAPDWIATCDMVLHLLRPAKTGDLVSSAKVLRRGRTTVVIEVEIMARSKGAPVVPIGLATVTFSVLQARGEIQKLESRDLTARTEFALPGSGFAEPFVTKLGARLVDAASGAWHLDLSDYNANSLGALQGGGQATLVDLAIESIGQCVGDASWVTSDFTLHFLALGKHGPLETSARVLRQDPASALVRVEIRDSSPDERLLAVATGTAEPLE